MDPTWLLPAAGAVAVAVVVAVVTLVAARRSRDRSLEPVRLGPQWSPTLPDDDGDVPPVPTPDLDARVRAVQERTELPRDTIEVVLVAWDEYLAVIGIGGLPATHDYRVYDPYDPPVAERGPDGPIPDPVRVARDVSYRTAVAEVDATTVLDALFDHEAGP